MTRSIATAALLDLDAARAVNLARLADRLRGAKRGQHHYGRAVSAGFYDDQEMR